MRGMSHPSQALMALRSRIRPIIGLDIEPGSVAAAQVVVNGTVAVERAVSAPLEPGVVRDGEVAHPEGLSEVLRELWAAHKGLDKRVRIGVANQRIVMRTLDLPPVDNAKDLAAAVRFSAQDALPMPLNSAVLDFQPLARVDTPDGPRQRVVLVAARREMVDRVLAAVRGAGLRPEGIDLSAFAMVRALRRDEPGATLYLSVGGLTNLAVADEVGCTFTRVSGGGLEAMSIELAERHALTLEHSRGWLTHVGLDTPVEAVEGDPEVIAAARGVLAEGARRIAVEVRASLDFHQAQPGASGAGVERVVLTGPAVAVPGFGAALAAELGMPVQERLVPPAGKDAFAHADPARCAVAAGLAVSEVPGS